VTFNSKVTQSHWQCQPSAFRWSSWYDHTKLV